MSRRRHNPERGMNPWLGEVTAHSFTNVRKDKFPGQSSAPSGKAEQREICKMSIKLEVLGKPRRDKTTIDRFRNVHFTDDRCEKLPRRPTK